MGSPPGTRAWARDAQKEKTTDLLKIESGLDGSFGPGPNYKFVSGPEFYPRQPAMPQGLIFGPWKLDILAIFLVFPLAAIISKKPVARCCIRNDEGDYFRSLPLTASSIEIQFQATAREYLSISCQVSWSQMMVVPPRYSDKYIEEEMRWLSTRWASLLIL